MTKPACFTCKHFIQQLPDKNTGQGSCRRYPPSLLVLETPQGPQPATIFPAVKISEWCGEYRVKILEASAIPASNPQ